MSDSSELIDILNKVKEQIADDSDTVWTRFGSGAELKRYIDEFIVRIKQGDASVLSEINTAFLPTSVFEEHAFTNNWGEEYLKLASRFEKVYARNK